MKRKRKVFPAIVDGEREFISKVPKDICEEEVIRLWKAGKLIVRMDEFAN
jgi:hypothetical protein